MTEKVVAVIELPAVLNEGAGLSKLLAGEPGIVRVKCGNVRRTNSAGIKLWIDFFTGLRNRGVKLVFEEVTPVLLDPANTISNFLYPHELDSFYPPFMCEGCGAEPRKLFKREGLGRAQAEQMVRDSIPCQCGASAVFDDIPDAFFAFLGRTL